MNNSYHAQCALYNVPCTVYSIHCTIYTYQWCVVMLSEHLGHLNCYQFVRADKHITTRLMCHMKLTSITNTTGMDTNSGRFKYITMYFATPSVLRKRIRNRTFVFQQD